MEPHIQPTEPYNTDHPITARAEDEFRRYDFARRVAQTIQQRRTQDSLVVALYARWGEGKTSLLNLIRGELPAEEIITVQFNPWRFADEAQLLMGFFVQFAKALQISLRPDTNAGQTESSEYGHIALTQSLFAKNYSGVANAPAPTFESFIEQTALESLKGRVEAQLTTLNKRVVVIMDDIDRLPRREIQALFRLIKLTADFRYTTYLLAFDDEMVAKAIGEMYEAGGESAGRSFLEKIIQVPIRLPTIQSDVMLKFFIARVNKVLEFTDTAINREDGERFAKAARSSIVPLITAPRHVIRYCNAISFSLPLLHGEANMVDVMLLEGLKLFYPVAYGVIADNQWAVVGADINGQHHEDVRKALDGLLGKAGSLPQVGQNLVFALFPRVEQAYRKRPDMPYSPYSDRYYVDDKELETSKSVASRIYFKRYFSYFVQDTEIPDRQFAQFVEAITTNNEEVAFQLAQTFVERAGINELMRRMRLIPLSVAAPCIRLISLLYAQLSDKIDYTTVAVLWGVGDLYYIGQSMQELLEAVEPASRMESLTILIESSLSLHFSRYILHEIKDRLADSSSYDVDKEESVKKIALLTKAQYEELIRLYVQQVLTRTEEQAVYKIADIDGSDFLLNVWPLVESREHIQTYLRTHLERNPQELMLLLRSQAAQVSTNFGPLEAAHLPEKTYEQMREVLDVDYLYSMGLELLDGRPIELPREDDRKGYTDMNRLQQFMYFHQQHQAIAPDTPLQLPAPA